MKFTGIKISYEERKEIEYGLKLAKRITRKYNLPEKAKFFEINIYDIDGFFGLNSDKIFNKNLQKIIEEKDHPLLKKNKEIKVNITKIQKDFNNRETMYYSRLSDFRKSISGYLKQKENLEKSRNDQDISINSLKDELEIIETESKLLSNMLEEIESLSTSKAENSRKMTNFKLLLKEILFSTYIDKDTEQLALCLEATKEYSLLLKDHFSSNLLFAYKILLQSYTAISRLSVDINETELSLQNKILLKALFIACVLLEFDDEIIESIIMEAFIENKEEIELFTKILHKKPRVTQILFNSLLVNEIRNIDQFKNGLRKGTFSIHI
ncbi:MAG: hypothetical protein ACXADY_22025 [Candidatus Hodarchaeales archaeon]